MPNPSRDTTAGRAYNDLRNLARRTGRGTDELLVSYALERFLFRLSQDAPQRFVLKGGLLLACFGARRATKDIDLLAEDLSNDQEAVKSEVVAVAGIAVDDGVSFEVDAIRTSAIREDADYTGVRVIVPAAVAKARLRLGIDVNFGDPVTPGAQVLDYPQLLSEKSFGLLGYPIETVIAEKLCTAIVLADLNTRERDYADLYRLIGTHDLDGDLVGAALSRTARFRRAELMPLSSVLTSLAERRQLAYTAWRAKQGPDVGVYPARFADVVAVVTAFGDALVTGEAAAKRWVSARQAWVG